MKSYKKKRHTINNNRDSERCNDMRKSINSSERQQSKREIKDYLECPDKYNYDRYDRLYDSNYPGYAYHDMDYYYMSQSHGTKFIYTLAKMDLLEVDNDMRNSIGKIILYRLINKYHKLVDKFKYNKDGYLLTIAVSGE